MIYKVVDKNSLEKIRPFFDDIRFFMGKSVLDGVMGEAYVDDILNPKIAFLVVRSYCFISGYMENKKLEEIINNNFKNYELVFSDELSYKIEKIYGKNIVKTQRYSIKKDVNFNLNLLKGMASSIGKGFELVSIDEKLASKIRKQNLLNITDDYQKYGIGVCCIHENEIVGVASSNIFYKEGIEVNIMVFEKYRRRGIATAMASKLILNCLKQNKKVSWDAANMESVGLAQKLGFEYDSAYNIYYFV